MPLLLVVAVLISVFTTATNVSVENDEELVKNELEIKPASVSRPMAPVANPATRCGPRGVTRLFIMVDRSHSVMNFASGTFSNVNATKIALQILVDTIGMQAQANGTEAYIYITAFADTAVWQNGPDRYGNDFFSWINNTNIANPAVREHVKRDVIGSNDDGIYFRRSYTQPAYKVVPGNPVATNQNRIRGYQDRPGNGGYTNFQAALEAGQNYARLFSTSSAGPDDDVDLYYMITDGFPTSNFLDPRGGSTTVSDFNDIMTGQGAANGLKLGAFGTIAPGPVKAILVGNMASDGTSNSHMNTVFGPGNFRSVPNYANLVSEISGQIRDNLCSSRPVPVNPSIQVVSARPVPSAVEEGRQGSIEVTVRNNGDVDLTHVTARIQRLVGSTATNYSPELWLIPFPGRFSVGETRTFRLTHPIDVPFGVLDPLTFRISINSTAILGPSNVVVSGSPNPSTTSEIVRFDVIRIPLPS